MDMQTESTKLAARFDKMAADGLVDVKFLVRNREEATGEAVCKEINAVYAAVDAGQEKALDFADSTHS